MTDKQMKLDPKRLDAAFNEYYAVKWALAPKAALGAAIRAYLSTAPTSLQKVHKSSQAEGEDR